MYTEWKWYSYHEQYDAVWTGRTEGKPHHFLTTTVCNRAQPWPANPALRTLNCLIKTE